jgi:predicted TPR repeat methyltransferase
MGESWDQYAEGWDSNADAILFSENAYNSLCRISDIDGLVILDFGCGTGLLTERMASRAERVLALDSSANMISVLRQKRLSNVETLVGELSKNAIKATSALQSKFDLIVASSVCAFLEDYEGTLRVVKSLLKPGGVFVQWDWLGDAASTDIGLTVEAVESAYVTAGLRVSSVNKPFSVNNNGMPMKVLMGVAERA